MALALVGVLLFSGYGTLVPASVRCAWPGQVGCAGGLLGAPVPDATATYEQFFNVTMYDYGFWVINTVDGTNETAAWYMYEGWTVHINATSLKPDPSQGGTAYHGLGIEINATGTQLLNLAARVGVWSTGSFVVPNHAYSAQRIWCTVECGPGHSGQHLNNVYIVAPTFVPSASIVADHTSGTAPLTVDFTGTIAGGTGPFNTTWTFGDGGTAYQNNASHTYTTAGKYSALFSVLDSKGFRASRNLSVQVTAAAPLTASASATTSGGVAPLGTTMTATPSGGSPPYSISWALGDGSVGTGGSIFHVYTAPGSYSAIATVRDSAGSSTTAVVSIGVRDPTGTFPVTVAASPPSGAGPLSVNLSASASGGTAPYSVLWIYGDGAVGTGASGSHTFAGPGEYEPTAFVTDSAGRVGVNETGVAVSGAGGAPFSVNLLETPSAGNPPLVILGIASMMGGSGIYPTVKWSFGDGSSETGPVVRHVYPNIGDYNVTLSVTDSGGAVATAVTPVHVAGLAIDISVSPSEGDAPLNVTGSASIQGGTGLYGAVRWTWGDGTASTGSPANHSYAPNTTGTLTIHASVNDSAAAVAEATATVTIVGPPVAVLTAEVPTTAIFPISVNLTLAVSGGTGVYQPDPLWDFGDGATTRGPSPQDHLFVKPGAFHVLVTTNDSSGVVATAATWVNLSAGVPAGAQGGSTPEWVFNGVANPDQAALGLMGFVAGTGLAMLVYKRFVKGRVAPPPSPPNSAAIHDLTPAGPPTSPGPRPPR